MPEKYQRRILGDRNKESMKKNSRNRQNDEHCVQSSKNLSVLYQIHSQDCSDKNQKGNSIRRKEKSGQNKSENEKQ